MVGIEEFDRGEFFQESGGKTMGVNERNRGERRGKGEDVLNESFVDGLKD